MIVETRYRDISFEQAKQCATPGKDTLSAAGWEKHYRGQPLRIFVPATEANHFSCSGPFFQSADDPSVAVCPHIAEIGD